MNLFGRLPLVGAYVCPRGVYTIECATVGGSLMVQRRFEVSAQIDDAAAAADQIIRALRSAGIERANVAVAMRGFGVAHHVLQMPPARDELLSPVVDREMRRLEPQLASATVGWIPLPPVDAGSETPPQRSLLAAAVPLEAASALHQRLAAAGYQLLHLTALPAAMQRLLEEFDSDAQSTAFVAPLPDGAFIGFSLQNAIRLAVEPPLPHDAEHESAALAEEVELGIMFVGQQFRGAHVDRVSLLGSKVSLADVETSLTERLHIPAGQVGPRDLSPAAIAALGAVLDARSRHPLALGGETRRRRDTRVRTAVERASMAAVAVVAILAGWVVLQSARAWSAGRDLQAAQHRVEQDAFGLAPLRSTANQRRMVRDAVQALRLVANDRADLQQTLSGISAAARPPISIDSLRLQRAAAGWLGSIGGTVNGPSNARAVETLHGLYRELPERLSADSVRLDQLRYGDTDTDPSAPMVRFQISFGVPYGGRKR